MLTFSWQRCHFITCILNRTNSVYHVFQLLRSPNKDFSTVQMTQEGFGFFPAAVYGSVAHLFQPHEWFQRKT
jgi:hypothetical protein